jgi:Protein of unknown function (DUF3224)
MSQTASGTFSVNLQPMPFEDVADEAMLGRLSINKQIIGDLVATTQGQMLSAGTAIKDSAAYVAIERVAGSLNGKTGSFVLQHTGIMNRGVPSLTVRVVPDSGTGELVGIQGEFKINIADGIHSYKLIYSLPEAS